MREQTGELIGKLRRAATKREEATVWSDIWSALCPEPALQAAAYWAVPQLVALAVEKSPGERLDYLHFVGAVEALRHKMNAPPIPDELEVIYYAALMDAASMIVECLKLDWDKTGYRALLGSLASVRAGLEFRDRHHGRVW